MCDDEDKLLGSFKAESLRVYYTERAYQMELKGWWQRPHTRGQTIRITGSAREDFAGRGLTVREASGDKLHEDDPITESMSAQIRSAYSDTIKLMRRELEKMHEQLQEHCDEHRDHATWTEFSVTRKRLQKCRIHLSTQMTDD